LLTKSFCEPQDDFNRFPLQKKDIRRSFAKRIFPMFRNLISLFSSADELTQRAKSNVKQQLEILAARHAGNEQEAIDIHNEVDAHFGGINPYKMPSAAKLKRDFIREALSECPMKERVRAEKERLLAVYAKEKAVAEARAKVADREARKAARTAELAERTAANAARRKARPAPKAEANL
jgi:hypothetical protein